MNDKNQTIVRVIAFIALTWLVLAIIPRFFSSRPQPTGMDIPPTATAPAGRPVDSAVPAVAADTGSGAARAGAAPAAGVVPGVATIPAAVAETTVVADSLSKYVFTNVGATVASVELLKHRRLAPGGGNISLLRSGESLLRYELTLGGKRIPLEGVAFTTLADSGADGDVNRLTYTATLPESSARLEIQYELVANSYLLRVNGRVDGAPDSSLLLVHMPSGLQSGEVLPVDDQRHYAIAYRRHRLDVEGIAFSKLDPGEKREERQPVSWLALKSKYFIVGLLQRDSSDAFAELHATGGVRSGKAATHMATTVVAVLTDGSFSYDVYAGPQEFKRMLALGRGFQNSNPYGGWLQPLVQPVAVLVMRFLLWLRDTTQLNYGWVLVIFGVVVRLLLWPLNQKAMRTSLRMQRIQPELSEVQKKHKENPQKLQEEIMRVYKSHGMTPFSPLAGCLPMLIPMPVLFALFFVFQNTIEFRGVPFLWLPDISLKDPLYIIPVFMGLSMFVMSWLGSRGTPPNPQTKMLLYFLPAMMTVLFLNFASGLNLYYAVQNLAAMPQQWLIARERRQSGVTAPAVQASSRKAKT